MNPLDYQEQLRVNRAIADGIQADTRQNPINAAVNNIVPNLNPADMVNLLRAYQTEQDLLKQKQAYEAAAQGDAGNAQRAASAAAGQILKNELSGLGVDISNANKLNAAGYAPVVEGRKRDLLSQIYSMPSEDEVYSGLYESKLRQGMGKRKAMEQAIAETEPYAAKLDRMRKIAMGQLGTENGVVNKDGYTSAILSANPNEALLRYASFYATPKDQWGVKQQLQKMYTAADIASGQAARNNEYALSQISARGEQQRALNTDKYAHDINSLITSAGLNMQAVEQQYKLMGENERARVDYFAKGFKNAGYSDGESWAMAIGLVGKNKNQQTQEKEPTAKEKDIVGEIGVAMQTLLKNAIGDDEGSKSLEMDKYEEIQTKRAPHLPYDVKQEMEDVKNIANFWAEYNRGGKGKGKSNENTRKYAREILENERILKLAEQYTPGISKILEAYKEKNWRK